MLSNTLSTQFVLICSCAIVLLSSCAAEKKDSRRVLTPDQRQRQQELLQEILDYEAENQHTPKQLIGMETTDLTELLALADGVSERDDGTYYFFSLEGLSENQEGWGWIYVVVNDEMVTDAVLAYPEW